MYHLFFQAFFGIVFFFSCGVYLFGMGTDRIEKVFVKLCAASAVLGSLIRFIFDVHSLPQPLGRTLSFISSTALGFACGVAICLNIYIKLKNKP
jgi:hypothetical protein